MERAVDEREPAERERERRAQRRAAARERGDPGDGRDERDQPGQRVLAEPEARAPVHERVVERVHQGHGDGRREDGRLAGHRSASSKNPTTRRSYSSGRASSPPTWPDSGISHSVLLAPAAAW